MRVLVLSHMYPSTFNEVSGIFVHEQVKALVEKGIEVQVVSPVPWAPFPINRMNQKWKAYSEIPAQSMWDGIKVWYPRYLTFPKGWFFASSGQQMYHGIKDVVAKIYQEFSFDLIHAHVALPDGYAGALWAREHKKPLVITIHGQDLQHTVFRSLKCRQALQEAIYAADRVIVVSRKLKRVLEESFPDIADAIVVNNGVDPEKIFRSFGNFPKRWQGKILILSVSNLILTKGIYLNLQAISRLVGQYPDLLYVIVGNGELKGELKVLVKKLCLEDYVEFAGRQPHGKVMEYVAKCDIFSLPSWREGFGVVYLEAMAHGKPVIGCQGEGIEDVIEHGKTGLLVKPRNVNSLVEALDFLLSHPEKAKAMGERARKLVLENFTWEKNAEKTISVYEEVLRGR